MDVDRIAARMQVGCDYCGHRKGLEIYDPTDSLRYGFRCADAKACDKRELSQLEDEEV